VCILIIWQKTIFMTLYIFTDGASLGNPGPMGIGIVIKKNGSVLKEISEYIGEGTNNIAEYTAVIRALEYAKKSGESEVHLRSDSQLIVRQLNGDYKTKDPKLKPLKRKIDLLLKDMNVIFEHIPREQNKEADELSKKGAQIGAKKKPKTTQKKLI
jgi:ribonuclease HI